MPNRSEPRRSEPYRPGPDRSDTPPPTLDDIVLPLQDRRVGKVRVSYRFGEGRRLFVTTDRLSAFDRIIASVPHKGQVLNQLSAWWFGETADIVDNHLVDVPDPNVTIGVEATPLLVEVVVRGAITGVTSTSLWTRYADGARTIDGHRLPDGLHKNALLPEPVITPTTKATGGAHDVPLSCSEVADRGLVEPALWKRVQDVAVELFRRGAARGRAVGLLLADTKYEFGLDPDGRLLLIDEVHTPDSSRWWRADSYDERIGNGDEPENLDKEFVRRELAAAGYSGEGPVPEFPTEFWAAATARYVEVYERLTGSSFEPGSTPIDERIRAATARLEES